MQVPLEISFHGIQSSPALGDLVEAHAAELDEVCDHVNSCRVALERPHESPTSGSPWRVRIAMTVAPGHELVVDRHEGDGNVDEDLYDAVNDAFAKAMRQLKKLTAKQQGAVKRHPEQMVSGVVEKVFGGYGFIRDVDGDEVYFHANSVLGGFDRVDIGVGVAFESEPGDLGRKATTVRIIDGRHGRRGSEDRLSEPMI